MRAATRLCPTEIPQNVGPIPHRTYPRSPDEGFHAVSPRSCGETWRVPIRIARPSDEMLRVLLTAARSDSLTYEPIGISRWTVAPPGYVLDRYARPLGTADATWRHACDAIRTCGSTGGRAPRVCRRDTRRRHKRRHGRTASIVYVDIVCRIVDVNNEPGRVGFSYGTLSNHPEQGEESFTVHRRRDGEIVFEIVAVSRPRQVLARAFPPDARYLQRAATNRYLDAMAKAAEAVP